MNDATPVPSIVVPAVANAVERPHHPYSPSTLQALEACPHFKSRGSEHERTIAGTLAHGVVETGEDNPELSDDDAAFAAECIDFREGRREYLEAEAHRISQAAFENAKKHGLTFSPELYRVEELKEIYLPVDDCQFPDTKHTTAGYVDCVLLGALKIHAEVLDWKFGRWAVEEAEKNLQGIAYVVGLFKKYPTLKSATFWFKQPLINKLTSFTFRREDIASLFLRIQVVVARARKARELAKKGDWSLAKATVPICNFCDNIADCPVVQSFALQVAKKFSPLQFPSTIQAHDLSDPHQTGLALQLASVVKIWAESYRSRKHAQVLEGRADMPEGYELGESSTRRSIIDMKKFKKVALRFVDKQVLDDAADYTFGPIEKTITTTSPRGQKKMRVEEFQKALLDEKAVKPGEPFTFLRVKASEKTEEKQNENKSSGAEPKPLEWNG